MAKAAKKQIRARTNPKSVATVFEVAKQVTPAPAKSKSRDIGKYMKLGFMQTWAKVFEQNETTEPEKRLTDPQIKELMLKEFPTKKGFKTKFSKYGVNYYRLLYNKGWMTLGEFPAHPSFRYNEQGNAVDLRTGRRVLTPLDRKLLFKRTHERYQRSKKPHAKQPATSASNPPASDNAG